MEPTGYFIAHLYKNFDYDTSTLAGGGTSHDKFPKCLKSGCLRFNVLSMSFLLYNAMSYALILASSGHHSSIKLHFFIPCLVRFTQAQAPARRADLSF